MTARGPREKAIVNAIAVQLKKLKRCFFVKTHGSIYMPKGTPDILGCYAGRAFALEVKRPGNHPTPMQEVQLMRWREAGAVVAVVHSAEEALNELGR